MQTTRIATRPIILVAVLTLTAMIWMPLPLVAQEPEQSVQVATADLVERANPAVVLLEVEAPDGTAQGSGFLIDEKGIIVTNQHVIAGATAIRVKLPSEDVFERVEVMDSDPRRDLAILRVRGFGLPTVELANSDSVRVGDAVVSIGSPLGLENSVSTGIVSGRREHEGYHLLQITAPISPGSSGGPVFGPDGSVVGVAVAQIEEGQNLNFAVPINYARGMAAYLPDEPKVVFDPSGRAGGSTEGIAGASDKSVNKSFDFDLADFVGYEIETEEDLGNHRTRKVTVSYRRIGEAGDSSARIERFAEFETSYKKGVSGDRTTLDEGTMRSVARASDLAPLESHLSVRWSDGRRWLDASVDLTFADGRAQGVIRPFEGEVRRVDRTIPRGTILKEFVATAIGHLSADSLAGRNFAVTEYDPKQDQLTTSTVTFEARATTIFNGSTVPVYRTIIASDADRHVLFYRVNRPRLLLGKGGEVGEDFEVKEIRGIGF